MKRKIITFTVGASLFLGGLGLILTVPIDTVITIKEAIGFFIFCAGLGILLGGMGIPTE